LCKFLPISLEPGWFCTLALKSKPPNFFAKIISGSATCHFFTKQVGKNGNPHRLGTSGSFRALPFHVGLKSGVTNSKKILFHTQKIENELFVRRKGEHPK
jgi:hypothetical protein